jgi:UDP-N-acetylmuramoyl-tripeptide--D-alanyl-D-alanine ligase
MPVVGITGSCGKTTTKELLAAALSPTYNVAKPRASHNNVIGVSLTILSVRESHNLLIVELGTNAPGEIEALCRIARPTAGIITNIGHTHLEGLGSRAGVKKEKGSLIQSLGEGGFLVTNIDCPECRELVGESEGRIHISTVATATRADHPVEIVKENESELVFRYDGIVSTLPLIGGHNAINASLAAATAGLLGVEAREALKAMSATAAPSMRMQRELVGGVLLINDAYNSNFESLRAAVETLDKSTAPGRKILVCGDMLELGRASQSLHRAIGWHIGKSSIDVLVTVGTNAAFIASEAHKAGTKVIYQRNGVDDAGRLLKTLARRGDVILFKASRGLRLERAVDALRNALTLPAQPIGN